MLNKSEIDLFQMMMDAILRKHKNFAVPYIDCLNMTREIDSRSSMQNTRTLIDNLCSLQYLAKYTVHTKVYFVTWFSFCFLHFMFVLNL